MIAFFFFPVVCSPAEAFFKQAIEIKENALGNDHPSLVKVSSHNSLSDINRCGSFISLTIPKRTVMKLLFCLFICLAKFKISLIILFTYSFILHVQKINFQIKDAMMQ